MKAPGEDRVYNILVFGDNHQGKSSLCNTFGHVHCGWGVPRLATGRHAGRGTIKYSKHQVVCTKSFTFEGETCEPKTFNFFDTAGRKFKNPLSSDDKRLVKEIIEGMAEGTDLTDEERSSSPVCKENKIDTIIILVNAESLIKKETKNYTTTIAGWWSNTVETHTKTTEKVSCSGIGFVQPLYDAIEELVGSYPLVCCTHMDKVPQHLIPDVKAAMKMLAHESNICYVSTWGGRERRLSEKDKETYYGLTLKMVVDVDGTQSRKVAAKRKK